MTVLLMTSPDGVTWTARTVAAGSSVVTWGASDFFVVPDGASFAGYSPDGIAWTPVSVTDLPRPLAAAVYGAGVWVGAADDGGAWVVSALGSPWTQSPLGVWPVPTGAGQNNDVCWDGAQFVATGWASDLTRQLSYSSDGLTWSDSAVPGSLIVTGAWLASDGSGNLVVSGNRSGGTPQAAYVGSGGGDISPGFTPGPAGFGRAGFGSGQWVLGGAAAGPTDLVLATSPDGTTWTPRSTPFDGGLVLSVARNPAGLWVAVGFDAARGHVLMTSSDGVSWTIRSTPMDGGSFCIGYDVAWSPTLGLWCVVGFGAGEGGWHLGGVAQGSSGWHLGVAT